MKMARRSGGTHKGVEEKRRMLPIYQHYTLSPGKTKSHHPEAKCNHCLREFVCGSKQRLIRHLRKCNSISNPDQIIAETLNTLARNSATGQLNHSILEASNLLPSQISHIHHSTTQHLVGQAIHNSSSVTTANSNINNISSNHNSSNHKSSGSSLDSDPRLVATSSNGSTSLNDAIPVKRPQRRGRKPGNQCPNNSGIHVTTGSDGKTHFTPASQMSSIAPGTLTSGPSLMTQMHNGRGGQMVYPYQAAATSSAEAQNNPQGSHMNVANSIHMPCATLNHHIHHPAPFKLNTDLIDKAYLKLVLTRNLPLSLCDTKEFHQWVRIFANDYKPPSSINLITQNLKQEAQAAKNRVSNILVKASRKTLNLELHGWHDELRAHLWYAITAVIDHKRFLVSVRDIISSNSIVSGRGSSDSVSSVSVGGDSVGANMKPNSAASDKILTEFIDDCIKRVGSDRVNSLMLPGKMNGGNALVERARASLYATHPSIVTYYCWWNFTNLLCSDIMEHNENFQNVMRSSKLLINFVNRRPHLGASLEKFAPFVGVSGTMCPKENDSRWYSHLVCYLLDYIKNNQEAIQRALENYSPTTTLLSSDNNNNSSGSNAAGTTQSQAGAQHNSITSTQQQQTILYREDSILADVRSIVMSTGYWTNLNAALAYLKPIRDLIASTSLTIPSNNQSGSATATKDSSVLPQLTPSILTTVGTTVSLSDYMDWILKYGKTLIESLRQSSDSSRYQLTGQFLHRFTTSISDFKLLFAAYLLNPKHRCAFLTQRAKDLAIEEILNIASEFMPEESDGHTIFDQWKLYLIREAPYDIIFEESRSTPLEWWMSLPCAESIRRVALRILRLRAFTSPKPESIFSQLYHYENETKTPLARSSFEDIAILRYFYDYEDKIGQTTNNSHHNFFSASSSSHASNNPGLPNQNSSSNGCHDRTQVGQVHNDELDQMNDPSRFLPSGPSCASESETNGTNQFNESISDSKPNFTDSYSCVGSYLNHNNSHMGLDVQGANVVGSDLSPESLPDYEQFSLYVDYNDSGVQIVVEEPIEKKKRKWTAREILSKCQSNH